MNYGKTRLDYVAKGNLNKSLSQTEMSTIVGKQRYPVEAECFLTSLATESVEHGIVWVAIKAYNYGVITGKQKERSKCRLK